MNLPRSCRAGLLLCGLFLTAACTDGSPTAPAADQPWLAQFTFGNSSINTMSLATNQDGVSRDYLSDWVAAGALPNADLELFITHAYLPAGSGVTTRVSGVSIQAQRTDGWQTPNIVRSSQWVGPSTLGGQTYDVFRLEGLFLGSPALRPANFANVVFSFEVEYADGAGSVVHARRKTIELYKR